MIFCSRVCRATFSLILAFGLAAAASAQTYLIDIGNLGSAVVVEQQKPAYPGGLVSRGQEGWVRMHFVVTADGSVADPVIIDSSGGVAFEKEAIKASAEWRFQASKSGEEMPNNLANIRTRIRRGQDGASTDFFREYRGVMRLVTTEQMALARTMIDETRAKGGWNLYESTMLWLLVGRVESAAGNLHEKLEAYRRALSISTQRSLGVKDRLGLLGKIFTLQDELGHYAAAQRSFERLRKMDTSSELAAELAPRAAEIEALLQSDKPLVASATIYNPCNCDAGQPLWYYKPARRTFSFANLDGNVERIEARCETHRIRDDVEEGKSWTLAPEWGNCRVFVFGDDGASFDFVEHPDLDDDLEQGAGEASVARNHGLDRRN
ncbi:MAG: energy transducer TonB [Woeseiaceae bacterium]